jgi:hypothetical protein
MFTQQRRNDLLRHIYRAQRKVTWQASEYNSHPSYNTSLPCDKTREDNEMGGTRNTRGVDVKYVHITARNAWKGKNSWETYGTWETQGRWDDNININKAQNKRE